MKKTRQAKANYLNDSTSTQLPHHMTTLRTFMKGRMIEQMFASCGTKTPSAAVREFPVRPCLAGRN
jgi:hypothetical protein